MMKMIVIVMILTTCVYASYKPVLVQLIHRHGARTPFENLPGLSNENTHWNCSFAGLEQVDLGAAHRTSIPFSGRLYRKVWIEGAQILPGNCAQGVLTDQGALMLQDLGRWMRNRYVASGFLDGTFQPNDMSVRSTNVPRTFHSVENLLKTMFPTNNTVPQSIAQVITISTIEKGKDYAAPDLAPKCLSLDGRCSAIERTSEFKAHLQSGEDIRKDLESIFGVSAVPPLFLVMDTLRCLSAHDQSIVIPNDLYVRVQLFATKTLRFLYTDPMVSRLGIGTLLNEIADNMASGGDGEKFKIYSAHDTTIGLLLGAMQIDIPFWPVFASNILIEYVVESGTGNPFVQVLYDRRPVVLKGQSSTYCPYDDFVEIIAPVVISASERAIECDKNPGDPPFNQMVQFLC